MFKQHTKIITITLLLICNSMFGAAPSPAQMVAKLYADEQNDFKKTVNAATTYLDSEPDIQKRIALKKSLFELFHSLSPNMQKQQQKYLLDQLTIHSNYVNHAGALAAAQANGIQERIEALLDQAELDLRAAQGHTQAAAQDASLYRNARDTLQTVDQQLKNIQTVLGQEIIAQNIRNELFARLNGLIKEYDEAKQEANP